MLVLKLILTPLLIGLASMAGRRWGPTISGLLIGLPLTSVPVALFLALELGTTFASNAAQGILLGGLSQAAFCLTYAWLSLRLGWLSCWLVGWSIFFAATFVFIHVSVLLPLAFAGAVCLLLVILLLWPKQQAKTIETKASAWEVVGRMLIATAFVLILTAVASVLGPRLSGLLSPLPIFATIFAIFTHRFHSATAARHILHGVVISAFACAVFFLIVAALLERLGIAATFAVAVLAALLTQGSVLWLTQLVKRFTTRSNTSP